MVLPNIEMNPPQVYMCSPSRTLLPPLSPYHPSGSSQCTSPKHPVSCIEPGLATRFIYDIIRISMSFSQIIPPSPFPTESKRLFYNPANFWKKYKPPKCLSTVNGRKTVGNTLAVECSSSVRKNKQLINRATWMNLHGTTLSEEKAHPRGYVLYDSTFKTFLKREQIGIVRV